MSTRSRVVWVVLGSIGLVWLAPGIWPVWFVLAAVALGYVALGPDRV